MGQHGRYRLGPPKMIEADFLALLDDAVDRRTGLALGTLADARNVVTSFGSITPRSARSVAVP